MKIEPADFCQITPPTSMGSPSPLKSQQIPADSSVTMVASSAAGTAARSAWATICSTARQVWEFILWVICLCPSEKVNPEEADSDITYVEALQEALSHPEEITGDRLQATELLALFVTAALTDPKATQKLCTGDSSNISQWVSTFRNEVSKETISSILRGSEQVQRHLESFLSCSDVTEDNLFLQFFLQEPSLITGALQAYCTDTLNTLGKVEARPGAEDQLSNIQTACRYMQRLAQAYDKQSEEFNKFAKAVLTKGISHIAQEAVDHFDEEFKPTPDEYKALVGCFEDNYEALLRLEERPDLLSESLEKNKNLGREVLYRAIFSQLEGTHFSTLAKMLKAEYPLAFEVCKHLEEIAECPELLAQVRDNAADAYTVLQDLYTRHTKAALTP